MTSFTGFTLLLEMATKSDELDARCDIYPLGIVTYEILTGHLPFQSDATVGYLRKHLQDAPPPSALAIDRVLLPREPRAGAPVTRGQQYEPNTH